MEFVSSQKLDFNKLLTSLPNANTVMLMDVLNAKKIFIWDLTENVIHMKLGVCLTLKESALNVQSIKDTISIKMVNV